MRERKTLFDWCVEANNEKLLNEWDHEKNNFAPDKITFGSEKPVWWKCQKGHEWKTSPNHRTGTHHTGCPFCSNRKILVGYNDLATTHPELALQWDNEKNGFLTPQMVVAGSNKKVWWKCNVCKQSWRADVVARTTENSGCPICSHQLIVAGYNDLPTKHPQLVLEWDHNKNMFSFEGLAPSSKKKAWWLCPKGHSYQTSVVSRARLGTGCPECAKSYQCSMSEKIIGTYLKRHFGEVQFGIHPEWLDGKELDIFIPSINVAVEYDGGIWHTDVTRDIAKDNKCIENNIELIRIRDGTCPQYDSPVHKIYSKKASGAHTELQEPILALFQYVNDKYKCNISTDIDIARDKKSILAEIDLLEQKNSIANSPLEAEWNYKKTMD